MKQNQLILIIVVLVSLTSIFVFNKISLGLGGTTTLQCGPGCIYEWEDTGACSFAGTGAGLIVVREKCQYCWEQEYEYTYDEKSKNFLYSPAPEVLVRKEQKFVKIIL
jgi:hypothetical protein